MTPPPLSFVARDALRCRAGTEPRSTNKVRYDRLDTVTGDRRLLISSLVINWLVGPAVMFALAWIFLADLPEYRTGSIIVGLARCIAMIIIWNDLACGHREAAAVLVALNSVFQVLLFGVLGWFHLDLLPGWLGLDTGGLDVSPWLIALNVVIFLGIPLAAGLLTRTFGEKRMGRERYESAFLPRIGPWALYGLLFTIVLLFALQGDRILGQPLDVARIAVPLPAYFVLIIGSAAPLAANVAVADPTAWSRIIHAWPSVALIGAYELLMREFRTAAKGVRTASAADGQTESSTKNDRGFQGQVHDGSDEGDQPDLRVVSERGAASETEVTEPVGSVVGPPQVQRDAWLWAVANRRPEGSLPSGQDLGERFGRKARWGSLVKQRGQQGLFEMAL